MKKLIVILFLAVAVISCGSSKTVKVSKKVIKGEWTLKNITFSTYGTYKVTFFNDVDKTVFQRLYAGINGLLSRFAKLALQQLKGRFLIVVIYQCSRKYYLLTGALTGIFFNGTRLYATVI